MAVDDGKEVVDIAPHQAILDFGGQVERVAELPVAIAQVESRLVGRFDGAIGMFQEQPRQRLGVAPGIGQVIVTTGLQFLVYTQPQAADQQQGKQAQGNAQVDARKPEGQGLVFPVFHETLWPFPVCYRLSRSLRAQHARM